MSTRNVTIPVRVTPAERELILKAAKAQALSVSALMRSTMVRVAREILQSPATP